MLEGPPHRWAPPACAAPTAQALLASSLQAHPHLQINLIVIMLCFTVGKGPQPLFRVGVLHSALPRVRLLSCLLLCCAQNKAVMYRAYSGRPTGRRAKCRAHCFQLSRLAAVSKACGVVDHTCST